MKSIRISCSIMISAFFPYRTGLCRLFGVDLIVRLHARTPSQNPEYSCPALHFNLFEILLLLLQFNENLVGLILLKQNNLNIRKLVWDNAIFSKSNESEFSFKKSTHMTSDPNCAPLSLIHLIPKWRPINYSFVCMFISPLCLIFHFKILLCFLHADEASRAN